MISLELAGRIQRGSRIILGTGLQLDQDDDGATILSVAPGISSIGVQDANSGPDAATRLIFQGNVVSVTDGIATFDFDGAYQARPPAGYSWLAGNSEVFHRFTTPFGSIRLGPANANFAHIYADLPFYFNQELKVNGSAVWHAGNDGSASGLDADMLDGLHGSSYAKGNFTINQNLRTTDSPTFNALYLADSQWLRAGSSVSGLALISGDTPTKAVTIGSTATGATVRFNANTTGVAIINSVGLGIGGAALLRPLTIIGKTGQDPWISFSGGNLTKEFIIGGNDKGFSIYDQLESAYRLTVDLSGNVGIGTNVPAALLHVAGDARVGGLILGGNFNRSDAPFSFLNGSGQSQTALFGALLVSNSYSTTNQNAVPTNGIYVTGAAKFGSTGSFAGDVTFTGANGLTISNGWCRVSGNKGIYFEDWTGGWFMQDATYIRAYNDKSIYTGGSVRASRYYPINGSTYYIDPDGTSSLSGLSVAGALDFASVTRQMLNLYGTSYALGVQSATLYFRSGGGYAWFKGGAHASGTNDPGTGGTLLAFLDSTGNLHATRYYDLTGSTYYLDPNGTSPLNIVDAQILRIQGSPVAPTIVSTTPPGDVSIYPVGTRFIVHA